MNKPERVQPGARFSLRMKLNLARPPSFYPTLWASPEPVTIMLKGRRSRLPAGKRAYRSGREERD
jgi:hypothetical protein